MAPSSTGIATVPYWGYLAAAAVLTDFTPEGLLPLGGGESDIGQVAAMLAEHGTPIRIGPAKGRWSIGGNSRRAALSALVQSDDLLRAIEANRSADRPDNWVQRHLDALATSGLSDLHGKSIDELLGLERALDFIGPAVRVPPRAREEVLARIERLRLLEPLQRLVVRGFAGRVKELVQLRAYVDDLPSKGFLEFVTRTLNNALDVFRHRPPLVVWGPGGVGKSTLLAQFVLEHAGPDNADPTPFVYLDFDRGMLDATQPDTLLAEAFRQIQVQFPDFRSAAQALELEAATRFMSADGASPSRSAHYRQSLGLREGFVNLVREISASSNRKFLLFIDTFEIVQRRGSTSVLNVLTLCAQLLRDIPSLRLVIAGRTAIRESDFLFVDNQPTWQSLNLQGFDKEAGRAWLRRQFQESNARVVSNRVLDRLVALVQGNPLSLRLAAQAFARNPDLGSLEDAVSEAVFDAQFNNERVQGMLHSRIIDGLDEPLRKVADPGLILRRITPLVIERVLAGPCDLSLDAHHTADDLFAGLEREVALVEPMGNLVLRHRPDVRLLMLPLLRAKLGRKALDIDRAAVAFWRESEGANARAEEIYHLLWLGADSGALDEAWARGPVARAPLEEALDELEALGGTVPGRIWLCRTLQREITQELERRANLIDWEYTTELRVRSLLSSGSSAAALKSLRARDDRTLGSPLWLLEVETLKLLGADSEALEVVDRALEAARDTSSPKVVLDLLLSKAGVLERMQRWEAGLHLAGSAIEIASALGDDMGEFEASLARARFCRRLGDPEAAALREAASAVLGRPALFASILERPSLLAEAAAEIGDSNPLLVIAAAERFGGARRSPRARVVFSIGVAIAHLKLGRLEEATRLLDNAAREAEQLGDPDLMARALLQLANAHVRSGRLSDAIECYQRCVVHSDRAGLTEFAAFARSGLGQAASGEVGGGGESPGENLESALFRDVALESVDQSITQVVAA